MRLFTPLAIAVTAATAASQPSPYHIKQLAPGVHAVVRDVTRGTPSDSNVLIIINDADVVVVDANIFPESARQTVREIRKLTNKPVRYVVNTHWHSDHHYGNAIYAQAYPGVEFVGHPYTRHMVLTSDMPDLAKNIEVEYPAEMAKIRKALDTRKRSNGEPVTPDLRKIFEERLEDYRIFIKEMKATPVIPSTLTVADSLVLERGERSIVIKHLGIGNTAGDLIVYLPEEKIIATGDLVVNPVPFAFNASFREWPNTLRALTRLEATTIVPGHGEVESDWSYANQLVPLFEAMWDQVGKAVASGADLEATRKAVNLDSFRPPFGATEGDRRLMFDVLFLNPGIESAYNQLKADRPKS
jgi:glyoxylase-like metal-dependent hydrolase (beta-lactamase superfamily II)